VTDIPLSKQVKVSQDFILQAGCSSSNNAKVQKLCTSDPVTGFMAGFPANSGCCSLQSADVNKYIVPRTNTRLGVRSFTVTGPRFWNTLPAELCQPNTELVTFRWLLKTNLFKCDPDYRTIWSHLTTFNCFRQQL